MIFQNFQKEILIIGSMICLIIVLKWIINKITCKLRVNKVYTVLTSDLFVTFILPILELLILVVLQNNFNIIVIENSNISNLSIIISLLTLYGIYVAFIQFATEHASQSRTDLYWGKSITKILITENHEYKIFQSVIFKVISIYSTLYAILNKNFLDNFKQLSFTDRLLINKSLTCFWEIGVFYIIIILILLLFNSLNVFRQLFKIHERKNIFIKYKIEDTITNSLLSVFYKQFKTNREGFSQYLIYILKSASELDREDMVMYICSEILFDFKCYQKKKYKRISKLLSIKNRFSNSKNFFKLIYSNLIDHIYDKEKDRYYFLLFSSQNICDYINSIKLQFNLLLKVYSKFDKAICQQQNILLLFNQNDDNSYIISEENTFKICSKTYHFNIPQILINNIKCFDDLVTLNNFIHEEKITFEVLNSYDIQSSSDNDNNPFICAYTNYLDFLISKCFDYQKTTVQNYDLSRLFEPFDCIKDKTIYPIIQNQVLQSLINYEYRAKDKCYIQKLFQKLQLKYIMSFVIYRMFSQILGYDCKFDDDITFFRNIMKERRSYSTGDIKFVCNFIKNSNISHRISGDLVKWTLEKIKDQISVEIITKCNNSKYLNYCFFLKLKYIFYSNLEYEFSYFSYLKFSSMQDVKNYSWKTDYIREILQTPYLLKEKFFINHNTYFYEYALKTSKKNYALIIQENDFRIFIIDNTFRFTLDDFDSIIKKNYHFISNGIIDYLILNIANEGYGYLLVNSNTRLNFLKAVNNQILHRGSSIKEYVSELILKANECIPNPIPKLTCNRILIKLYKALYSDI